MGTLIGRERQLREVQDFVEGGSGLVLVLGKPGVGKRLFMDALRRRLSERHAILPVAVDGSPTYLTIDTGTDVGSFREQVSFDIASPGPDGTSFGSRVLFVYGYQPATGFATWFRTRYVPSLSPRPVSLGSRETAPSTAAERRAGPPRTVMVMVAFERDVCDLLDEAALVVRLDPLSVDVVRAHLAEVTSGLREPLGDAELTTYAELVAADASLLGNLERVLALDAPAGET